MPYTVDERTECVLRSAVGNRDDYITLAWPRELSLRELQFCVEIVNLSLGGFVRRAQRREDGEAEWASWFPDPFAEYAAVNAEAANLAALTEARRPNEPTHFEV